MPAYSTDKGFTGSGAAHGGGKEKAKSTGGAGAAAQAKYTQPRDPAGPEGKISGGSGKGPGAKSYSSPSDRGGGTTTTDKYVPGAVQNFPNADTPTVLEKIVAPLVPGVGSTLGLLGVKQAIEDPSKTSTVLGGDPGPQRGWQPDRYRGAASLGGIGGSGGAVSDDAGLMGREIAGAPIGAGTRALTGDSEDDSTGVGGAGTDYIYSDVTLQDRRRPKNIEGLGAGAMMALGL